MKLSKYEQETIINFNAGERNATLYTRADILRCIALIVRQTSIRPILSPNHALSIVSREPCRKHRGNRKESE